MRTLTFTNGNGAVVTFSDTPYAITSLAGIDSPALTVQETTAPYQDGATFIDALFQPRDIVIEGAIASAPGDAVDIATARRAIQVALTPKAGIGTLTYTWDGGTWEIDALPLSSPVFPNRVSTDPYQTFQVTFHCPDPYWRDTSDTSTLVAYSGGGIEIPAGGIEIDGSGIHIDEWGGIDGQTLAITIAGDVDSPVEIVFRGPAENPKMTNVTTGEFIGLTHTLTAGQSVTINTAFGEKTCELDDGSNAMQYLDLDSTFFQLQPGLNSILFNEDSNDAGSTATVAYRNRYIGA